MMRDLPDTERQLRAAMADKLESIRAIDRVYGAEPNEWATATRERLWLEYFTADSIRQVCCAKSSTWPAALPR